MAETEIMFSYLIMVGFITVIISLSGQTFFGADFPTSPFSEEGMPDLGFVLPECAFGDLLCYWGVITTIIGKVLTLLSVPFTMIAYLFEIFFFFMTSPVYWWIGTILFVPAGIILLIVLYPIVVEVIKAIIGILRAIAGAIPFT